MTSAAAPSDTSEQSVRLSGPATKGFFSDSVAAEVEAEILAHLRVGVGDAVLVVLRRDQGERVGLVAVALEVRGGDLAEHAREAARRLAVLGKIGGAFRRFAPISGARRMGHLLDADHQGDPGAPGLDGS